MKMVRKTKGNNLSTYMFEALLWITYTCMVIASWLDVIANYRCANKPALSLLPEVSKCQQSHHIVGIHLLHPNMLTKLQLLNLESNRRRLDSLKFNYILKESNRFVTCNSNEYKCMGKSSVNYR